ncbi:MAG: hypothetical protein K2K20_00070, partial [Lachnospiraceae bacterium]|nr:hypothetical protein [Lachnospiraceae bacterium]
EERENIEEIEKIEKLKKSKEAIGTDRRGNTEAERDIRERILQLIRKKGMTADEILNRLLAQGSGMDKDLNISTMQGTLSELMIVGEIVCRCGLYEIRTCHTRW